MIDFKSIIDSLTVPTFVIDSNHIVLAWNPACERLTGIKAKNMIGTKDSWKGFYENKRPCLADLVIDDDYESLPQWYCVSYKAKFSNGFHAENWIKIGDKKRYLIFDSAPIYDDENNIIAATESLHDITEIKRDEQRLMLSDKVFTYTNQAIMITDAKHRIIQCNESFSRLTGYGLAEVIGKSSALLESGKHDAKFYKKMQATLDKQGHWEGEIWDKRNDNTVYCKWLTIDQVIDPRTNKLSHYVSIFSDITERKKQQDELEHNALHDPLTRLPNRLLFESRLEHAITQAERKHVMLAVLFVDLDRFKIVNDTMGHHVGDQLLNGVADRIRNGIRKSDTAARLGGDEFVILLENIDSESNVCELAKKLLSSLGDSYQLDNCEHDMTLSIGISLYPRDGNSAEVLTKKADMAMYNIKTNGKNGYCFYEASMALSALSD